MGNKGGKAIITNCSLQYMLCIIYIFLLYSLFLPFCSAEDTITSRLLKEGDTLASSGQTFELGFFVPGKDNIGGKKYIGIWYKNSYPKAVVWVANRDNPLGPYASGFFGIYDGILKVVDESGKVYWSANGVPSSQVPNKRSAKLMDTGNLVLQEENPDNRFSKNLWESFRNPTDTFLPGMKMDLNLALISWKAADDPATGMFTFKQDKDEKDQYLILNQSTRYWRSGKSANLFGPNDVPVYVSQLLSNVNNTAANLSIYKTKRLKMDFHGKIQLLKDRALDWAAPRDSCDEYRFCGKFGSCNSNNLVTCKCLPGFVPSAPENWKLEDFSEGCVRKSPGKKDTLLTLKMMKVGMIESDFEEANNADECRERCLSNLQCEAYAYKNINSIRRLDATGTCWIWSEEIYNLQEEYDASAPDIYIRVAKADIEPTRRSCGTCGTYMIPYPLSTGQDCGEPIYSGFNCKNLTGQVMFHSPDGSYKVAIINEDDRTLVIQTEARFCEDRTSYLRVPLHFVMIRTWCNSFPTVNGSDGTLKAAMISWELPMEPTCESPDVCSDWPNSSCMVASDGTKRCLCKTGFQWNASRVSCIQEIESGGSSAGGHDNQQEEHSGERNKMVLVLVVTFTSVTIFVVLLCLIYFWRRRMARRKENREKALRLYDCEKRVKEFLGSGQFNEEDKKGIDVPFFDLEIILEATDYFSDANKLGQGGFGPVYKGTFPEGLLVAVKRLSSGSGQGMEEFKNEVVLIAKLQHRNLVRLLGYCVAGDERILLYEYMPNKSLDSFIFDQTQPIVMDWDRRFNIILGIARGLLYLHQDSRLRIIHRDLKTSNILLDEAMNPKISDFGLARIVGEKQLEANTKKVVGTYGYMSPEYALDGTFSIKSDVFSFGVVLLEIIGGKRNMGFYKSENAPSLLGHAWRLWMEDKAFELLDRRLKESCSRNEVMKCINVGLLCVQEDPSDRPTMSNVVFMLGSETATLPTPKQPAFVLRSTPSATASSSSKPDTIMLSPVTAEDVDD